MTTEPAAPPDATLRERLDHALGQLADARTLLDRARSQLTEIAAEMDRDEDDE